MAIRDEILRKIERQQAELRFAEREWERKKVWSEAYIQALQETLRSLPRDVGDVKPEQILRAGGAVAKMRDLIMAKGRPLHVSHLLNGLGKEDGKKTRASVTSQLGTYVRRGEIFIRTGPNTFGLLEMGHAQSVDEEPPPDFGRPTPGTSLKPSSFVRDDESEEIPESPDFNEPEDDDQPF